MLMISQKELFFIGWDYMSSRHVMLKRVIADAEFPYRLGAIIHDEVYVDSVDGISLCRTQDFLQKEDLKSVTAILFVKDEHHVSLWRRRAREYGFNIVDEGEIFLEFASILRAKSVSVDLGAMKLPEAFDSEAEFELTHYRGRWPDAKSNRVFHAYLRFLETGLVASLLDTVEMTLEHPFFQDKGTGISALCAEVGGGLAWEVGQARTEFLEQVLLCGGFSSFAFSSSDEFSARKEADRLSLLFKSLDIKPHASEVKVVGGSLCQLAVPGYEVPELTTPILVRVDVDDPLPVLHYVEAADNDFIAIVRLGFSPCQLLRILQIFPIEHMTLSCDRPGPLGLQLVIKRLGGRAG